MSASSGTSLLKAPPAPTAEPVDDLELAALISSKICHDIVNPVGAIYNALEVLDDDDDEQSRAYALQIIRDFTSQASARVQFARFAFGAAGSAGATIDLAMAEQLARGFLGSHKDKHKLTWNVPPGHMAKNRVKLLLNLVTSAVSALPRGGDIHASVGGRADAPSFELRCIGQGARPPQHLREFLATPGGLPVDAFSVQAYYTTRLARACGLRLGVNVEGADVVLTARPEA